MSDYDDLLNTMKMEHEARTKEMPETSDALQVMHRAYTRLKELGWKEAIYCPKDGTYFEAIEAGSTGIMSHCHYMGEWPKGSWWSDEPDDTWPVRPILYRLKAEEDGR